jgi:hypothetical protein
MSTNANFKPLGQMVQEHAALDEKSTLSTVECLKLLEIRNAERHYTAGNLYGTALGIIHRQAEDLRRKDAENSRLAQLVCDFQSASMINVNGQDDPSEVTPKHVEDHIYEQRKAIAELTAALESLLDWSDGYSSLPDNYIRRNARKVLESSLAKKLKGE